MGSQALPFSSLLFNYFTVPIVTTFYYFLIPYCIFLGLSLGSGISNGTVGAHLLFGMSRRTFLLNKMLSHELILFLTSAGIVTLVSYITYSLIIGSLWIVLFVLLCWITFIVAAGIFSGVVTGSAFGGALLSLAFSMMPEISYQMGKPSSNMGFFVAGLTGGPSSIKFFADASFGKASIFVTVGLIASLLLSFSLMFIAYLFFKSRDMRAGR